MVPLPPYLIFYEKVYSGRKKASDYKRAEPFGAETPVMWSLS